MTDHFKGHWWNDEKTGCRNTKLRQEMEFFAHVWKSCAAYTYAHEEDDIKKKRRWHNDIL